MLKELKWSLFQKRYSLIVNQALKEGQIASIDDSIYDEMKDTYLFGFPANFMIRYLQEIGYPNHKCYDISRFAMLCLKDSTWTKGTIKSLEILYGKEAATHYWVERHGKVYDFGLTKDGMVFDRDLFYRLQYVDETETISEKREDHIARCDDISGMLGKREDYLLDGAKRNDFLIMAMTIKPSIETLANDNLKQEWQKILNDMQFSSTERISLTPYQKKM